MRTFLNTLFGISLCLAFVTPAVADQKERAWCYKQGKFVPAQSGEVCDRVRWLLVETGHSYTVECVGTAQSPGNLERIEYSPQTLLYVCKIGATITRTAFTCKNTQKKMYPDGPHAQVNNDGHVFTGWVDDVWCGD
jgi:hypothetical protein